MAVPLMCECVCEWVNADLCCKSTSNSPEIKKVLYKYSPCTIKPLRASCIDSSSCFPTSCRQSFNKHFFLPGFHPFILSVSQFLPLEPFISASLQLQPSCLLPVSPSVGTSLLPCLQFPSSDSHVSSPPSLNVVLFAALHPSHSPPLIDLFFSMYPSLLPPSLSLIGLLEVFDH